MNAVALGGGKAGDEDEDEDEDEERRRGRGGEGSHGKGHFGIEHLYSAEQRSLVLEIVGTSDWNSGRVWW